MTTSATSQQPQGTETQVAPSSAATSAKVAQDLRQLDIAIKKQEETISSTHAPTAQTTWWTTTSAMTMSATVLVFGLLTLALAAMVLRRGYQWEAVLKIFGTVLVIVMAVFLVVAGYDDKQIAGAVALLGTIAGYLLGKEVPQSRAKGPGKSN